MKGKEAALREALRLAMEKWREADWHWRQEFHPVSPTKEEHVPQDPAWARLNKLLEDRDA